MIKKAIIQLLNIYQQYISVMFLPACRFWPSCSEYTKLAVGKYGATRGLIMAAKRLLHCHPFGKKSGYHPLV